MKRHFLSIILPFMAISLFAQTAKEDIHNNIKLSAANYVAYMDPTEPLTPAPKNYVPFYISSYARHGSRWLINPKHYDDPISILRKAKEYGKLTPKGEDVLNRLEAFYPTTIKRLGELTTVGERQHHGIGKRLTERFPEVFSGNAQVDARSTVVIRCILSMEAECEEIAQFNSKIKFHNDVSESLQYYLNQDRNKVVQAAHEKYRPYREKYNQELIRPRRFMGELFNDQEYVYNNLNAIEFMIRMFDICSNMQSHDSDIDFYDLFTEEECYNIWKAGNIGWYIGYGPAPQSDGIACFSQENLLTNIIETADSIVNNRNYNGATLRFGHEVCVLPLACLMELGNYGKQYYDLDTLDEHWANYNIFPMASNIQLVFYRPKKGTGEILVKALLNEKEVSLPINTNNYPYYQWNDLRAYYVQKLKAFHEKYDIK